MDRDSRPKRAAGSSSRDGRRAEERRNDQGLPGGPLTNVAERLVTANPRDTARDLGSFKAAERQMRRAVQDVAPGQESDLSRFDRRNNQLGRSANDLVDRLTAGLGFNSDDVALFQVQAASNVGHFLGPQKQTALVNRIGNMDPMEQALGVMFVAQNFGKFNDQNKSRIFEQAIELAADPHQHHMVKVTAQNAIVTAYHQLDANQKAQANSLPDLHGLLQNMPPPQHAAEERSANLDGHIAGITASVRDTVGPQTSYEQLRRGGQVGQSISHAYNHAREDLMAASRSRERSGR
ncbi:hypothetical protein [Mesorhizobium japonicum]|uniref:hypothetical protein n=2 Tax=Mesorhizobium TaxID=68287 RepID=UPI0007FB9695|nr:hypothetical protein [Mesorhizobium japonicum]MUT27073.1 hypothetical protein [Mesorhizobium japonicum]OBQ74017.1 hypothetical protein A9K71_12925 [Mesorhizobium sp. WSM3873]